MVKMIIPSVVFAVMLVAPPQALHIDYDAPVLPATQHEPPYYPLVCDSTMVNVVQFQWLALPDEATDHPQILPDITTNCHECVAATRQYDQHII